VKSRGPGPDVVEPPKPPRKSLDERIAEAIIKTVPNLINQALKPVVSRLDNIDTRLDNLETRIDGLDTRLGNLENRVIKLDNRVTKLESH
jgi:archaellum component FlaC